MDPHPPLTATVFGARGVTVYKVLAGSDSTLAEYNDGCIAANGKDWQALYTQFQSDHVLGTVPYRWEKEGVREARLIAITFDELDIVVLDGPLMHDGSISGGAKAVAAKEALGIAASAPLMAALGERRQVALVRETEKEWELVVPHALVSSLRYSECSVARFQRHPSMPITHLWRAEGDGDWRRWGEEAVAPDCVPDLATPQPDMRAGCGGPAASSDWSSLEAIADGLATPAPLPHIVALNALLSAHVLPIQEAERFRRVGGVQRLTRLLRSSDEAVLDAAAAALAAIAAPGGSGGGRRALRFRCGGEGREAEGAEVVEVALTELGLDSAGTGYSVWSASLVLCRWLCLPRGDDSGGSGEGGGGGGKEGLRGLRVLELGSGLGVVGLLAAKLQQQQQQQHQGDGKEEEGRVVLSDFSPVVLRNLRDEIELNELGGDDGGGEVEAVFLDWQEESGVVAQLELDSSLAAATTNSNGTSSGSGNGEDEDQQEEEEEHEEARLGEGDRFDLILGADVLYEEGHAELVVPTVLKRLAVGGTAVLSMAVRQVRWKEQALELLSAAGLQREVIDVDTEGETSDYRLEIEERGTTQHSGYYEGGMVLIVARKSR